MAKKAKFTYRGEVITLSEISKILDMSNTNANHLIYNPNGKVEVNVENNYLMVDKLLDTYHEERQLHLDEVNKKLNRLYALYGEEPPTFTGKNKMEIINQTREKFNFSVASTPDVNSVEEILDVYYYLVKEGYGGLVSKGPKGPPIEHNGVTYDTGKKFYNGLKIIKNTFFRMVLDLGGDVRKAILTVENDPEFGVVVAPTINGVRYTSIKEASIALGFNPIRYKTLYREYLDFDVAYEKYLETTHNFYEHERFPLTVNGVVYPDLKNFADAISVEPKWVRVMYGEGFSFEDMLERHARNREYKELCNGRIKYRTKNDLRDILGITTTTINKYIDGGILGKYNLLEFVEMTSVYYNGELLIHPQQFNKIFLIPESLTWNVKLNIMEISANEEKVDYLFKCRNRFILLGVNPESPISNVGGIAKNIGTDSANIVSMIFNFDITDDVFAKSIELFKLGFSRPIVIAKSYYTLVDFMVSKSRTSLVELGELYGMERQQVFYFLKKYPMPLTEEDAKDFISKLEKREYNTKAISTSIWE